ncbi:MAG: hypothetical protein COB17_02070 [Sulfurimonas sp.]|nr:MAG: hypothetical protein COB17_02070 [Sulfurimonas sp.]
MAIGAIGNVIYVNQQTASVASLVNSQNNRVDLQNIAAQAAVLEKDEKVLELRPAEENHATNPDREHEKNSSEQELERNEKKEDKEEKKEESSFGKAKFPIYKLDIKV